MHRAYSMCGILWMAYYGLRLRAPFGEPGVLEYISGVNWFSTLKSFCERFCSVYVVKGV